MTWDYEVAGKREGKVMSIKEQTFANAQGGPQSDVSHLNPVLPIRIRNRSEGPLRDILQYDKKGQRLHWPDFQRRMADEIGPHLGILYMLATECTNVIEMGVGGGYSSLALLEGLDAHDGLLTSVDIMPRWEAKSLLAEMGVDHRWTFIQGDARRIIVRGVFDMAFIDAGHRLEETFLELENVAGVPIVLMHDPISCPEVRQAIEKFQHKYPHYYNYQQIDTGPGLGILART